MSSGRMLIVARGGGGGVCRLSWSLQGFFRFYVNDEDSLYHENDATF